MEKDLDIVPDRLSRLERLKAEHRELEARIAQLDRHLALSPAEQVERTRLKKLKLATKDRILSLAG